MSEIERKGGILLSDDEAKNLLLITTPGTVAEAISSALETADATGEPEDSSHLLNLQHPIIPTETFQTTNEDKLFLSSNNNNSLIDLDEDTGNLVRRRSDERLLEGNLGKYNGKASPFHEVHHNQNYTNEQDLNFPRRKFSSREDFDTGPEEKDCGRRFLSSSSRLDADGNHVCEIHDISSACSPYLSSANTKSSSMASENKESSEYYCVNNSHSRSSVGSDQNIRDKPDNREAQVSHCKEKPATAADESFESSARTGSLFKPSSKVIELPDRSTSSSIVGETTTHDRNPHSHRPHHHHHHHHRNKESKIPVGWQKAVAWQRLVTSSSSSPTAASAMTTKAEGNPKQKGLNSACSPSKYPSRPTSVSPLSTKAAKTNSSTSLNGNNIKSGQAYEARDSQPISDRPLSVCGGEGVGGFVSFPPSSASPLSRPLPSSSVPPNMGFPVGSSYHSPYSLQGYHHRSSTPFLEYPYGSSPNVDRTFAIPSPLSSPHHHPHSPGFLGNGHSYWGGLDSQSVPILTSGIPSSPGAPDYLSMQQQIHFHHHHQQHLLASNRQSHLSISSPYNPYLPFIYPHQDATSLGPKSPYYDHYFHHQQNELLRQQQLQHQQNNTGGGGSANGSNNGNNNTNNGSSERTSMRSSSVGGFDLLENNNRSAHQDRAVPMEVANSRTSIPLLSPLPTGGIRTTPSPASGALQAESAEISAAANTKTSCSTASTTISSSTTATQQTPRQSRSESGLASSSGELSSTHSSCSSASSPSPSFLLIHQQQHPHLFTSSSAALSPKSLTSSTPSPVTVHDFNSGLNVVVGSSSNNNLTASSSSSSSNNCGGGGNNTMLTTRKCATPSPISLTPRPLLSPFGSPFSPSQINNNNGNYKDLVWKQEGLSVSKIKPVPINGHCNNNSLAPGDQRSNAESPLTTTPTTSPLLHRRSRQLSVPTPLSSPNSQKHDFKRLESLIERRDSESISPLVLIPQHSPATSTTSSMLDGEEVRAILQGDGGDCEQKGNTSFSILKEEEDIEDKCRGKDDGGGGDDVETERLGTSRESNRDADTESKADIQSTAAGSDNSENDLFKVKQKHSSGGLPFPNEETKGVVVKAEKVLCVESCAMKSEPVANKNTTISSCDVKETNMMESSPPSENQLDGGDDDNVDDKIERNVVPESTLPFSSSCKSSSYNNDIPKYTYVKKDAVSAINTESCTDRQAEKKQQQSPSVKHDISLTSGYSSNDEVDSSVRIFTSTSTLKPKTKNKKGELKCKKLSPSLKIRGKKVKDADKVMKKMKDRKGKSLKSNSSDKTTTKEGKPKKTKLKGKTLIDWDDDETLKKRKKIKAHQNTNPPPNSAELANEDFVLSSSNNSIKKKEKGKLSRVLTAKRKDNGKLSLKTGGRKDQRNKMSSPVNNSANTVIHDSSHDTKKNTRNKRDVKMKKNGKLGKQGTLGKKKLGGSDSNANNKSQFLIAPPRQEHCSKMPPVGSGKQHGANVIGDISGKGNNCSFTGDHNNSLTISTSLDSIVSSPPSEPIQQQPVALILQSSSASLQTTTLRIPAYVPRSSATIVGSESFSSVMTDELVGDQDNYNGPATLTLHCDVDALAQQQQQIYYPQESLPPAITIQYHHSAPATPLMPLMDAASPLIKPEENSLNLLATVAQEFGSREDLGKRLSIDGSCNNSIIGESPPMSPMRSPGYPVKTMQHPQTKLQKYQSCIAPTSDPSRGIISDVVREVVELYHNDRSCASDKLKTQRKEELKKLKKARKMGEKTSNSIIAKKTKGPKAGKKEKRSISDGGAYSQNVVLKIPQVQRQILSDKSKLEKGKKLKKSGEKVKEKKSSKLSLLPLNIDNQKKVKREKSTETGKAKKATKSERNISGDSLETATLSGAGSSSLLKLTDRTPSPKKEKASKSPATSSSSSCFYTPPERISAFAKQVIARRDSVVATGSAPSSPTKIPVGGISNNPSSPSKTTTSSDFFPVMKQQELISPKEHCLTDPHSTVIRSPSVKMPLLTPFDLEQQSKLSKETAFTFSLAVPPPLVPSISAGSRKAGLHHRDHHSTKIPKQDKEKTDMLVDGSPSSSSNNNSSKDMVKVKRKKKDKTNSLDDEKGQQPKKKMKRKHDLPSGEDETGASKLTKKKNRKSESIPSVEVQRPLASPPRAVPKITITSVGKESLSRQYSFSSNSNTAFRTFSPLTPPPTAKSPLDDEHGTGTGELSVLNVTSSTPSSSHLSSPSNLENEEQGEAETTENENENDPNNVWVADPMFAVSAIKLSSSNQPSDTSSIGGDLSSFEDIDDIQKTRKTKRKSRSSGGNKDNRPPKLSLYNKNSCQDEPGSISADPHFLEVKSELKAFVHFKPKQLTSNKKGPCHIKPCLKAEPVVRSQSGDDDDEDEEVQVVDEDFELDLEVATITTQKPPKDGHKSKHPNPSSATSIISGSGKKQSINRNSLSYLSSSSSKKHQPSVAPLSTKEIMTKVFSRKVSPELAGARRKQHHHSHSSKKRYASGTTTGVAQDDEDELLDIEEPLPITKHNYHHHHHHHNAHVSMCAAAAAVIVQSSSANSSASSPTLPSTQIATVTASPSKKSPKKRSARSSTTSSSASTKSSSRGQRGLSAFSHSSTSSLVAGASASQEKDETLSPGKVELDSVGELVDEMRILTEIQGLFYTGRLNALQPPDVYGVTLDNERGAPPHLIFSAEEVLEKCLREKKPNSLTSGLRICAYWSPQYSGLYPGRVSTEFNPKFDPEEDLIPIEFDDGDTGMIKLKEIRLLSVNHPVREYDPNPLLTLEKKHRKRRHSSATGTSGGCTGDHDEPDCGEPYCAKIGKLEEDEEEDGDDDQHTSDAGRHHSSKMMYWTWSGLGYKRPKNKKNKNKNKEYFDGIQRGDEAINVGDAALFISTGNERPFIGRVERFWESKQKKMVNVRWFYHPEEVKASAKRLSNLKYPGALFESPHIDENDVQTIAKKCDVLTFAQFKQRLCATSTGSPRLAKLSPKSSSKPRDMYYVAGFYDPYTYNLTLKDLK